MPTIAELRESIWRAEQRAADMRSKVDELYLIARGHSMKIYSESDLERYWKAQDAHDQADEKLSRLASRILAARVELNRMLEAGKGGWQGQDATKEPDPRMPEFDPGLVVCKVVVFVLLEICRIIMILGRIFDLNWLVDDSDFRQHRSGSPRATTALPSSQRPVSTLQQDPQAQVDDWRAKCSKMSEDYANLFIFPSPPSTVQCSDAKCWADKDRVLPVCDCNVRAAFRRVAALDLKVERRMWHPDRFSACDELKRETFKAMAQEIFLVVDELYRSG